MNITRRDCLAHFFYCSAAASLSGCASTPDAPTTNEIVSSVLVSEDDKKLVVMTPGYHYIFELPPTLLTTLKSDFHPYVEAIFSGFKVNSKGQVSGSVNLTVAETHPEAVAAAIAAGFVGNSRGAMFKTTLLGERYKAGNIQPTHQYQLNKSYVISVQGAGDAGPTPIGVVGGTLVLSAVVLYLLFHPGWPAH
jgi:hypothetical protein